MFGWEFPPHIAGGLGTASYGLTKGLAKHGVKVMFVMPKAGGDEDQSVVKIINASDVEMMSEYSTLDEYWQNVKLYGNRFESCSLSGSGNLRKNGNGDDQDGRTFRAYRFS